MRDMNCSFVISGGSTAFFCNISKKFCCNFCVFSLVGEIFISFFNWLSSSESCVASERETILLYCSIPVLPKK